MIDTKDCMICYGSCAEIKLCCSQYYHIQCITEWVSRRPQCPICHKSLPRDIITELYKINECINKINTFIHTTTEDDPEIEIMMLPEITDAFLINLRELVLQAELDLSENN